MKTNPYYLTLSNAAHAARTTPKKMRECLDAIGCPVNSEGVFGIASLLEAVRINCDPVADRRACGLAMKQAVAKAFGKPTSRKAARD